MRNGIFGGAAEHVGIERARSVDRIDGAEGSESVVRTQYTGMELDVEKLFMITEALWNVLKEQHGYTDENLAEMVQDIDLRDGQLDGKVAKEPNPPCPKCGRTLMGRHPVCLYCGNVTVRGPFER